MPKFKVIRIVNPRRSKVSRRRGPSQRKKKNPGPLGGVLISMANTSKKRKSVRRRRHSNPAARRTRRSRRNSVLFVGSRRNRGHRRSSRRHRNPRRQRNPFNLGGYGLKQWAEVGVGAFSGSMFTRFLTEKIFKLFGLRNEGPVGYLGNIAVAFGLGYGTFKFASPVLGIGVVAGGLGSTTQRVWDERISKVIPAAVVTITGQPDHSGMGDVSYSDSGVAALSGYYSATWPEVELGSPLLPEAVGGSAPMAMPAPASRHRKTWRA